MAHLIGVIGVPGSGKSHFARSASEVGQAHAALIDPKEQGFYAASACDTTVLADLDWRPHLGKYEATAYNELLAWLDARGDDDSEFVIVDPFSEVSDITMHEVLKIHSTNDPSNLEYGRAYIGHDQKIFSELMTELRRLVVNGKTVICTFHGTMAELEGQGEAEKRKAMSGQVEWKFNEQLLPAMLTTKSRQRVGSSFNLWLYTVPTGFDPVNIDKLPEAARAKLKGREYFVTAVADAVRPAKNSVTFKDGVNPARLPNTVKALLEAIEEHDD